MRRFYGMKALYGELAQLIVYLFVMVFAEKDEIVIFVAGSQWQ